MDVIVITNEQTANPLLCRPSPRDIPEVKKLWHEIPYDKFMVKYKGQLAAYTECREFFLDHTEYTHMIFCPDDLEVYTKGVQQLIDDVIEFDYPVISGYSNIDEGQMSTLALYKLGTCNFEGPPQVSYGSFMDESDLPEENIFQVGHVGFSCEMIERSVLEKVTWRGNTDEGHSNFDWQFSKECDILGIPIMIDKRVFGYHRRFQQLLPIKWKERITNENLGYSIWLKDR